VSEVSEHIQYFHGAANTLDPGFHRGDKYNVISSQLQGKKGRGYIKEVLNIYG
jgi:hypothetical protein